MDLQGKVIAALEQRRGTSARGEWVAQDFVIETHDSYPRKMVFTVFGEDRLQRFNVQIGQEVTVSFDIDAHEYNGRWYNSIRAYDVRLVDPAQFGGQAAPTTAFSTPAQPAQPQSNTPDPFGQQTDAANETDDLPF